MKAYGVVKGMQYNGNHDGLPEFSRTIRHGEDWRSGCMCLKCQDAKRRAMRAVEGDEDGK